MILLVDIGNTRIKWARVNGGRLGRIGAVELARCRSKDFERVFGATPKKIKRVVVSSVAADQVNRALLSASRRVGAPPPEFVQTARRACGITVAYREPWRFGVDRFLMLIAAHARLHRAVCIVGVGTAMTLDLLDDAGLHLGGAIIPAPPLMVASLLQGTSGIRERARGGAHGRTHALFARSTRAAIKEGARFAAAATVERAVAEARGLLGRAPHVVLTGGGALELQPLIRVRSLLVPDLVLQGLAVWAAKG